MVTIKCTVTKSTTVNQQKFLQQQVVGTKIEDFDASGFSTITAWDAFASDVASLPCPFNKVFPTAGTYSAWRISVKSDLNSLLLLKYFYEGF